MKAIFFAQGVDIVPGVKLRTFANVSVYPFIAQLLGLNAPRTDVSMNRLVPALVESMRPARPAAPEGGPITAPKVIYQPEAEFSELARKKKISGNVLVP